MLVMLRLSVRCCLPFHRLLLRDRTEPLKVHSEYAALLIVASRLLWVKAPELHKLVAHLEQSCLEVEEASRHLGGQTPRRDHLLQNGGSPWHI